MLLWDISWFAHTLELSAHPQPRPLLSLHCKEPPKTHCWLKGHIERIPEWHCYSFIFSYSPRYRERKPHLLEREGRGWWSSTTSTIQSTWKQVNRKSCQDKGVPADGDTHHTSYLVQRRKKCHKEPSGFASPWMLPKARKIAAHVWFRGKNKTKQNLTMSIYFVLLSIIYIEWMFLQSNY